MSPMGALLGGADKLSTVFQLQDKMDDHQSWCLKSLGVQVATRPFLADNQCNQLLLDYCVIVMANDISSHGT